MADPEPGDSPRLTGAMGSRGRGIGAVLVGGAVLGALLLLAAEFTALYTIHAAGRPAPLRSTATGSHDSYALVPVAVLTLFMAYGIGRAGTRLALLAVGVLGALTLALGLIHDLPDAQRSGLLQSSAGRYEQAAARPSAGLYLETLGGVVLILTSVSGFILIGPPPPHRLGGESDQSSSNPAATPR